MARVKGCPDEPCDLISPTRWRRLKKNGQRSCHWQIFLVDEADQSAATMLGYESIVQEKHPGTQESLIRLRGICAEINPQALKLRALGQKGSTHATAPKITGGS